MKGLEKSLDRSDNWWLPILFIMQLIIQKQKYFGQLDRCDVWSINKNNPPGCVASFISICQNWAERFLVNNVRKQYCVLQQEILVKLLRPPGLYDGSRSRYLDILIKRTSHHFTFIFLKSNNPPHPPPHSLYQTYESLFHYSTSRSRLPAAQPAGRGGVERALHDHHLEGAHRWRRDEDHRLHGGGQVRNEES